MNSRFDYTILDAINNAFRAVKAAPLVLGSTASGAGGPPGGIVGWLPQARVAYDPLEISSSGTALSGMSIVDNLNHIRYRLDGVEASGSSTFLGLSDTPASYFGEVGKAVIVNATEDGLEFAVISGGTGATAFLDLTDVTGDYSLNAGFTVKVNNTEDGLIFDQETFLKLADAPHDYATYSGKYVKVNATEDALEFGAGVVNDLTVYEDGIQALTEVTGLDFVGLLDVTTSGNTGIVTFSGYSHTHVPNDIVVATYPEMILNGGFDDGSIWGLDAGWSIGGGVAIGTAVDGFDMYQEATIDIGDTYRVSFDITVDSGDLKVHIGDEWGALVNSTGHYEEDIVLNSTYGYINIYGGFNSPFTGTVDNVSMYKVPVLLTDYLTKVDTIETGAEVNNISDVNATDLTDSGETTLHSHPAVFAGHIIQDEGTPLTTRGNLNFVGSGIEVTDDAGNDATIVTFSGGGGSVGTGTPDQVVKWGPAGNTLVDAALIPPATNILTLTATAASTLGLAITAGKTLTLTATDNFNLTISATGTVGLLATAQTWTAANKINVNSTTALFVEQDGVKDNVFIVDTTNARVGINKVPSYPLDIDGIIMLPKTTSATVGGIFYGASTSSDKGLLHNFSTVGDDGNNIFVGGAGNFTMTSGGGGSYKASYNSGIGVQALVSLTNGFSNFGLGFQALFKTTIGQNNVSIGTQSGYNNVSGSTNIYIGGYSGNKQTTSNNLIIDGLTAARSSAAVELTNAIIVGKMSSTPAAQTLALNAITKVAVDTTTNNAPLVVFDLNAYVSTASTGFTTGGGVAYTLTGETATDGTSQIMVQIAALWTDATNATRKATLRLSAFDTAEKFGADFAADGTLTNAITTLGAGAGKITLSAAADSTLTIPTAGNVTAALLGTANVFTAVQKINVNNALALLVEQDGVKDNTFIVDTTNARVGVNIVPSSIFHVNQPAGSVKGIYLTGDEFYQTGNGTTTNGVALVLGVNRTGNVQLWIGDIASVGVSTKGIFRCNVGGTNIARIDAVTGTGSAALPINLGGTTSSVAIGNGGGLAYNATLPAKISIYAQNAILPMWLQGSQTADTGILEMIQLEGHVLVGEGTAATIGFGVGISLKAETATNGLIQTQAQIASLWTEATNATRKAKLQLSAYDTGQRIGLEMRANGTTANNVLMGDTWWEGAGLGLPYGSCWGNEIAWAQAAAAQNTWYEISDADMSDGQLNLVTHDGSGKLTVSLAGKYLINYSISAECNTNGKHIQSAISVSGTEQNDGMVHHETHGANEQFLLAGNAILNLAANATIEISIRTTDTGAPDLAVDHLNITLVQVGG